MSNGLLKAILYGGLVAGTLDIGAASLINLIDPLIILRVVASGLLGKASYAGGLTSSALGMVLQWLMSLIIAAIYVLAGVRMRVLLRRWLTSGLAYGVVVFFVMNFVVVPLSRAGLKGHFTVYSFCANMLAMLLFGVIIAWCAKRYVREDSTPM